MRKILSYLLKSISQNNNYGWPLATYGTNYVSADAYAKKKVDENKKEWPLDITANTHNSFAKPLFLISSIRGS